MDYVRVIIGCLSWNAMSKLTNNELELISDADMYLFLEKGIRRGVSYISK